MNRRIILAFCGLALTLAANPLAAQQQFVVDSALAESGRRVFTSKACIGCHTIGKGDLAAPDLGGLLERRSLSWITNWLRDPKTMLEKDDTAKALLKQYNNLRMPDLKLSNEEIKALMHYIALETKATKPSNPGTQ